MDLDGEIFPMDNGYWTKFEVNRIKPTKQIPYGIKYSLTLHDRNNTRIFGLDNAHGYKPRRKKYGARKVTWNHEHRMEKIHNYEFESASQLIEYFWNTVKHLLK